MTQIFVVSTLFGGMTVAAAVDAGMFGPRDRRRILLVSNNAAIPEMTPPPDAAPGFGVLTPRFDDVISWNAEIAPLHPSGWLPRLEELPLLEHWLRDRWGLGDAPVELIVESIAVSPARTLCTIFHDATVTVYSDGLMSYGPTRVGLPAAVGTQITRQLHLDLVPGLKPQLLAEFGVPAEVIPDAAFQAVLAKVLAAIQPLLDGYGPDLRGSALIVGQYLAALEILAEKEEDDMHVAMLRGAVARGHSTVLFKPHPSAPPQLTGNLSAEADRLGARLLVIDEPVPAEAWCAAVEPGLIVGCFSTALITAARYFGVPAATVGTPPLLDKLAPYQNSNRIPVTIIDTTLPHLAEDGTLGEPRFGADEVESGLTPLLTAVSYCMQAKNRPDLRRAAIDYLADHYKDMAPYFKRRRLTKLDLPGALPTRPATRNRLTRRLYRAIQPPQ